MPNEATLGHLSELNGSRLSPHFTLRELCKTSVNSLDGNIPGKEEIENLKRLCPWLEELRYRYNRRYVSLPLQGEMEEVTKQQNGRPPLTPPVGGGKDSPPELGGDGGGLNKRIFRPPLTPPNLGGEEEPIVITSGYRSETVNRCVGGAYSSNHLTGCAVDIRCAGVEQAIRYAAILLDIADEWKKDLTSSRVCSHSAESMQTSLCACSNADFDELLIERNRHGRYWVHFAVRPPKEGNRRKVMFLQK